MLHNVLVCFDGSRGADAQRECRTVAIEFARHYGARLSALFVIPAPAPIASMGYPPELAMGASIAMAAMEESERRDAPELHRRELEREQSCRAAFLADARAARVEGPFTSVTGDLVQTVIDHAHAADLVLLPDAHEARNWPLMHLVRSIARPVLLASRKIIPIERIAVAYDGSVGADRALQVAVDLAIGWPDPKPEVILLAVNDSAEARPSVLAPAEQYLRGYHLGYRTHVSSGRPSREICAAADEEEATLLCMGAYGHSALREALLGSTTDEVVERSHQPLVLCH